LELVSLLGHRRSVKDITETGSMDSDARGNITIIITKVIKIDWQRRDHFALAVQHKDAVMECVD
jgi:hypothetical protein